ncbi:MAG: hypothetical protein KDA72_10585, partial [Planctomycetales bacterium]|nr:hypothetical protein [Planctomycetales bacterium]
LAQRLVEQGYLSYDDLSVIEPDALMEMGGMTAEQVDAIVEQADERALVAEKIADEAKKLKRELAMAEAAGGPKTAPAAVAPAEPAVAAVENTAVENAAVENAAEENTKVTEESDTQVAAADKPTEEAADIASADTTDESTTGQEAIAEDASHESLEEASPVASAPEETMDQTNVADRN